ncbi:MAG: methionine synthase [Micropruina sp.]|nr:methionine synthase [Micropruina sp.]
MVGASGLGSLPGTDFPAAVRLVFDALGELEGGVPHLPELPARGPWAGMVGRSCALLVDLPVSLDAGTWRLSDTAGIDARRARTTLRDDLDRLQEHAADWDGPVKVQLTGPWTLAASVLRPLGGLVLADRSARRDLAQSLAQGTSDFLGEVAARLPRAQLVLQVDEPGLPAVLTGGVPTEGGFFRHRRVDRPEAAELLGELATLTQAPVLHCCAPGLDPALVGQAGFGAVSLDQDQVRDWDAIAGFVDSGHQLWLGCLPTASERVWSVDEVVARVLGALRPLELGERLADGLVLTPACGLAGWSARGASSALRTLVRAAALVDEALRT